MKILFDGKLYNNLDSIKKAVAFMSINKIVLEIEQNKTQNKFNTINKILETEYLRRINAYAK